MKRPKSTLCRVGRSLGLAAALVAATGLCAAAGAQPTAAVAERGDLALVPYYTVRGQWVTGISEWASYGHACECAQNYNNIT